MNAYYPGSRGARTILGLSLLILLSIVSASCSKDDGNVKKSIEAHLKDLGVRDVNVDLFIEDPNDKSRAYTSATVTYNFARGDGRLENERLGYILKREGQDWKIEQTLLHTKEKEVAMQLLTGSKPARSR